ncbi:MAG: MoaD/ThiS family protein [Pseudomonadota bacterium]
MRVTIPSPLLSYTGGRDVVAEGGTLELVLRDLDRQFPGIRFRVVDEQDHLRPHMRVFVGQQELRDLTTPLDPAVTLHLIQALSGG